MKKLLTILLLTVATTVSAQKKDTTIQIKQPIYKPTDSVDVRMTAAQVQEIVNWVQTVHADQLYVKDVITVLTRRILPVKKP